MSIEDKLANSMRCHYLQIFHHHEENEITPTEEICVCIFSNNSKCCQFYTKELHMNYFEYETKWMAF